MRSGHLPSVLAALISFVGCSTDATQLVVVAQSDLTNVGRVRASLLDADGRLQATHVFDSPMPFSFGVAPIAGAPEQTIEIRLEALDGAGRTLVARSAQTSFVAGESRVLTIFLGAACTTVQCSAPQTCANGTCVAAAIDPTTLPSSTAVPPGREIELPGEDAGIEQDSGVSADAEVTDIGAAQDALQADAGLTDVADIADAVVFPDAVSPDSGVAGDSGPEDSGPVDSGISDAGTPDSGAVACRPFSMPSAQPTHVWTATVPHAIDGSPIVADLDGDGFEEIIVANSTLNQISVVNENCVSTRITTRAIGDFETDEFIVAELNGGPRIIVAEARVGVTPYRYDGNMTVLDAETPIGVGSVADIAGTPEGDGFIVTLQGRDRGTSRIVTSSGAMSSPILTPSSNYLPSYLDTVDGLPRFLLQSGTRLHVLTATRSEEVFMDQTALAVASDASLFRLSGGLRDDHSMVGLVSVSPFEQSLRVCRFIGRRPQVNCRWYPVGVAGAVRPIATRGGTFGEFALFTDSGAVQSCQLQGGGAFTNCNGVTRTPRALNQLGHMITGYIDDNQLPDQIMVGSGWITFSSVQNQSELAPPIRAREQTRNSPALMPTFYARFGLEGRGMVVAYPSGRIDFIGWSRRPSEGNAARVWSQYRGRPSRSGALNE